MIADEFGAIDTDGSGTIEMAEFVEGARSGIINQYFRELAATLGGKLEGEPEPEAEAAAEAAAEAEEAEAAPPPFVAAVADEAAAA